MNDATDLAHIRQKVLRESKQDGIIEIWAGMFFMYYAVFFDNIAREIATEPAMVVFFIMICSYPLLYFTLIRNIFTYPRMGYVNINEKFPLAPILAFVVPVTTLPAITFVAVHWMRELVDIYLMLKWMSVLFGLAFGGLYFGLARGFALPAYYILATLAAVSGVVLSMIPHELPGVTVFLVLQSLLLLLYGSLSLFRFIRKYPRPKRASAGVKGNSDGR